VPFRGVDQTFLLFHRSLWDWVTDLLQDPQVGPNFVFDAQRLSKFNGENFVRFIHEPWTANAFWEYQVGHFDISIMLSICIVVYTID
jgi:hypothetical protein